jgi:leucyl aminopeptidase
MRFIIVLLVLGLSVTTAAQQLPVRGMNPLAIEVDGRTIDQLDADAVVIPVFTDEDPLQSVLRGASAAVRSAIAAARAQKAFPDSPYHALPVFAPDGFATKRLLLMSAGAERDIDADRLRRLAGAAVRQLRAQNVTSVAFWVRGGVPPADATAAVAEGALLGGFDPGIHKTGRKPPLLAGLRVAGVGASAPPLAQAVERGTALGSSQNLARSLIVEPSNYMTPEHMAQHARQIAAETGLEVEILDEKRIASMGMGGVIAVGQGAAFPPRFITLRYKARGGSSTTLAIAGKGVTFDSGGISLKDGGGMYRMKGDMAGGAAVLGAMRAIAALEPSINVIGLVPAVMNLPDGTAQRPGDVFTNLSGRTVEVMSTDAEGRLILSDALSYAVRQGATHIVDIATLTGSVVTALGDRHTGAFTPDDAFFGWLTDASRRSGESFWRLPVDDEYASGIRSSLVADLNETGGGAGASVGAKFIQHFAEGRPWIHLDIAGTSWPATPQPHMAEGPTGVTVRTLAELAMVLDGRAPSAAKGER